MGYEAKTWVDTLITKDRRPPGPPPGQGHESHTQASPSREGRQLRGRATQSPDFQEPLLEICLRQELLSFQGLAWGVSPLL